MAHSCRTWGIICAPVGAGAGLVLLQACTLNGAKVCRAHYEWGFRRRTTFTAEPEALEGPCVPLERRPWSVFGVLSGD
jgi:hypothetical protein